MQPVTCKVCLADNRGEAEALGLECLAGSISWREACRRLEWAYSISLKNHMENHYVDAVVAEAEDELDTLVADAIAELRHSMRLAPAEVKPLYAAAIVNLRGLKQTKPSQQHLIQALKTIQEMTGMRSEQRVLLQFAEAMFGPGVPKRVQAIPVKALPAGGDEQDG